MNNKYLRSNTVNKAGNVARLYLLLIITALSPATGKAQADIHFSQFYETSILRNPALTGVFSDDYKLGLYYRNQWSSITHPYSTALFSAEGHVPISSVSEDFVSFGILGYSDRAGSIDQKITTVYPALNYNKCINTDHNTFLSVGFTGGYNQYSFDPSKTTFNNQYLNNAFDPSNPSMENLPNAKMSMWDLGAGINYNTSMGEDNRTTYVIGFSGLLPDLRHHRKYAPECQWCCELYDHRHDQYADTGQLCDTRHVQRSSRRSTRYLDAIRKHQQATLFTYRRTDVQGRRCHHTHSEGRVPAVCHGPELRC